jgi:hypothetical protein
MSIISGRALFLGANVINISRQTHRVIVAGMRIRYDDADRIPAITAEITELLKAHPVGG